MFETLKNAWKIADLRKKILFTLFILLLFRIGSAIPVPFLDPSGMKEMLSQSGNLLGYLDVLTGGALGNATIFAMSITPYITSSIIIQLLTIAIPKLEEMQKEGEEGRKVIAKITRYVTVALALIESTAMTIGFGRSGLLIDFTWYNAIVVIVTMTAGSAMLMWLGERITEKGVGNGISIILLVNILSGLPDDFATLYSTFMSGKSVAMAALAAVIIVVIILAIVGFVVMLQGGERRIPVQYAKKMQGRRFVGGQSSNIPLKVNTAGVIPVIFASSLMSFPVVIAQFFSVDYTTVGGRILQGLSSSNWCNPDDPILTLGLIVYIVLIIAFAYFYTSITFNPIEIADNMKKQGGFIPGIRPGRPTSDYLNRILNYIVFIGAVGLLIVAVIPIIFSGLFGIGQLSFGGTSIIIIVGVILETLKLIESLTLVRYYKGFLND